MWHHPSACHLADSQVKNAFGERVCKGLVERGPQNLREIVIATEFPHLEGSPLKERRKESDRLVRAALQVLLQHSYVLTYLVQPLSTRQNPNPTEYQIYCVDVAAIIRSIRFPHYLQHVQEWFIKAGNEDADRLPEAVVTALLENGRLTLKQITLIVAGKLDLPEAEAQAEGRVREAFLALLADRFIERAVPCDLPLPPPPVFAKLTGRRVAAAKPGSEAEKRAEEERQRQQPATDYRQGRYRYPSEFTANEPVGTKRSADSMLPGPRQKRQETSKLSSAPASQRSNARLGSLGSLKVKPKVEQSATAVAPGVERLPELWQVSHITFTRHFRYHACADYLERKYGDATKGRVVRAILRAARSTKDYASPRDERTSAPVTAQQVEAALKQLPASDDHEAHVDVAATLERMAGKDAELVMATQAPGQRQGQGQGQALPSYCLNLSKIVQLAQMKELQGVVQRQFGVHGVRIWNCLIEHKQIESMTVHRRVLVPHKETCELLYRLLRAGFTASQDIPRTNDHAPTKTIYTWKVDLAAAAAQLATNMVKGVCNLQDRLQTELNKRHQLLAAMEKGDVAALSKMSGVDEVREIIMQLDCQMLGVAPAIALLTDF